MNILGYILVQTCGACPEQYDVFSDTEEKNQVGYLRLRHGHFTVSYLYALGKLLYEANPRGDGIFDSEEREYYLKMAVKAIDMEVKGLGYDRSYEII